MYSGIQNIELSKNEDIGIITLNNPPKNYLTNPEFVKLNILKRWIKTEKLKGLIITGSNRVFSAGADLNTIANSKNNISAFRKKMKKGVALLDFIENLEIPVAAAVNGSAFGGGFEIALAAHVRIASANSFFSFPETALGLIPGLNGSLRLKRLIKRSKALELLLSGEIIDAEKALETGIIDEIVPKNEALNHALTYLKKITHERSIEIINFVVSSLNNSQKISIKKAMKKELVFFCKLALKESKNLTALTNRG